MRVAILGPVCKDYIKIDNETKLQIGGIPYYTAHVFDKLGTEAVLFLTYALKDDSWVKDNLKNISVVNIPVENTLEMNVFYSRKNPDVREVKTNGVPNVLDFRYVKDKLKLFDYIIFAPLFHDNIPNKIFRSFAHKNLVLGNFGMFAYAEKNKVVYKNPENLVKIAKYLDYLFLDENEVKFAAQKDTIQKSARYLQKKGVENVVITNGSKGSYLFIKDKEYKIPAYSPKKIGDPTGAGDTYMAAFIRSLELFDDPEKQGKFAAMAATLSIEQRGAFDKSLKDIYDRLKTYDAC